MKKNCGHNSNCGCKDTPLTTNDNPCTENTCIGDSCADVYCQQCISYCQDDMEFTVGSTLVSVDKGTRLDVVLQKLIVLIANPNCENSTALGLKAHNVTSNSMTLTWEGSDALTYKISVIDYNNNESQINITQGLYQYELLNLVSNKIYKIKIVTDVTLCESITIKVKTL